MQDELLIRFIDGKCTKEESEKVIEDLSRDGNDAAEWLQMVAAARLADSKPVRPVPSSDARRFVSEMMEQAAETRGRHRGVIRWASVTAGLCAVAASIAIAVFIKTGNDGNNPEPMNMNGLLASSRDSVMYAKPDTEEDMPEAVGFETEEDMVDDNDDAGIIKSSGALIPDEGKGESHKVSKEYVGQESVPQSAVSVVYDSNASKAEVSDSADSTSAKPESTTMERKLEMIRPYKSPYRVKVENLSKDFVFEWKCDGEAEARLVVIDCENRVLVDKIAEGPERNRIRIPIRLITDKGELVWTLAITFPDGSKTSRTGRLVLKSEIE